VQSRYNLGAELDERGDRGDQTNDGNCFSYVAGVGVYLSADDVEWNDILLDINGTYK
jgi:hypothetical protein